MKKSRQKGHDDQQSLGAIIQSELGRRVTIKSKMISQDEAGEILKKSVSYQLYKDLTKKESALLSRNLILDNSIFPSVILDDSFQVIDGHQRLAAFAALKGRDARTKLPVKVVYGLTEEEKIWLVRSLNDNRRHLSSRDKRVSVARSLKHFEKDGIYPSDRSLAKILAMDHKTVGAWRKKISGEQHHAEKRTGSDGKVRSLPNASVGAWNGLKSEYQGYKKPGDVMLLFDDLTDVADLAAQAKGLANLSNFLLMQVGGALVYLSPHQVGEVTLAFNKSFDCKWIWPVILPNHLFKRDTPKKNPACRYLAFFIRKGRAVMPHATHVVCDMRKHTGADDRRVRNAAFEKVFSEGLKEFSRVHCRCLSDKEGADLSRKYYKPFLNRKGESLK